jgi:molybdenum cofactor cytidylyltransferase
MGQPKMVLPWGDTTVIGRVVQVLQAAGLAHILVVVGGANQSVEAALQGIPVQLVFNPDYANESMLSSLRTGIVALPQESDATLVVLGDQPQIEVAVVSKLIAEYQGSHARLVIPSYQRRRGHPWLVVRDLWADILALEKPYTLRDFLNAHGQDIQYLDVETDSILLDLDTPDDYQKMRP